MGLLGKNSATSSPTIEGMAQEPQSVSSPTTRTATPIASGSEVVEDGKTANDSSKLRMFLSILKRFIGVSDLAAIRFSLPTQLMEPIPNLEYWHYLDRPEAFVAIGDSADELGRMLGCLRFWFTKDLKYVKGKPCKPYNSALGEFFRCQWDVQDTAGSLKGPEEKQTADGTSTKGQTVRVNYITEQTSHHPPVSAWYAECAEKNISARGYDQLSAKFTGTSIKVTSGQYNEGIFIDLHKYGEEYHMTHPAAYLTGFLRGNLYVSVADICTVTCAKTGIKTLLHYLEEGYFGKTQNKVEGVVYKCDVATDKTTRIKDVPESAILGRIEGSWTEKVYFSYGSTDFKKVAEKDKILFVDLVPLMPSTKVCPPLEEQLPNESRLFWKDVTEQMLAKQFSKATNFKTEIEEKQREKAAERKAQNKTWKPRFFTGATDPPARPELTADGKSVIEGLKTGNYHLAPPDEFGAM
ncbi:hypothetical protein AMS68_006495 [Peltaster fructicola]|uniref:Oxysterol-binding protein n=1 Tax=Peltaster fructicola TaxID=286661 RepID=A0A6H0Y2A2_9PEZI|nr:hypothetical protein AMS68_006495 [Peltaster fructicola]